MLKAKHTIFQGESKKYFDAAENGELVLITAPKVNVVMLTEEAYEEMAKAKRNAEYLAEIDRRHADMMSSLDKIHALLEVHDE